MKNRAKFMVTILLILALVVGAGTWFFGKSLPYPEPSGEYKVGTVIVTLDDSSRIDLAYPEKKQNRQFVARIWYPANPAGNETMLPIMEKAYAEGMKELYGFPVGKERPSHSHINAPAHSYETKYPIVIFTHGSGSFMTQNLTTYEDLASQGFIVISLSFPYESAATIFPDGTVIKMKDIEKYKSGMKELAKNKEFISQFIANTEEMKNPEPEAARAASMDLGKKYLQLYPDMEHWLNTRIGDLSYLLNNLDEISISDQKLSNIADTNNIGLFGHSFGGLTTMKFLMENDLPAVKCGIALDVPYFIMDSSPDISLKAPLLTMSSEFIKLKGNKVQMRGLNDYLKHYTDQTMHEVNVKGAAHYNFSDMNYLPPVLKLTPLLGSISQREAIKIMSFYINTYFKEHLKSEDLKKLESDVSKDVEFREIK